jgi:acyl carrier protein
MDTIETRILAIISKYCESEQTLQNDMVLDELDIASINIMEIIISVEEEFGITVEDNDLLSLSTIQSVIDYVNRKSVHS